MSVAEFLWQIMKVQFLKIVNFYNSNNTAKMFNSSKIDRNIFTHKTHILGGGFSISPSSNLSASFWLISEIKSSTGVTVPTYKKTKLETMQEVIAGNTR